MNTTEWLIVAGLVLFMWIGVAAVNELRLIRATLTEMLGSTATALWRIRDELIQLNKHDG